MITYPTARKTPGAHICCNNQSYPLSGVASSFSEMNPSAVIETLSMSKLPFPLQWVVITLVSSCSHVLTDCLKAWSHFNRDVSLDSRDRHIKEHSRVLVWNYRLLSILVMFFQLGHARRNGCMRRGVAASLWLGNNTLFPSITYATFSANVRWESMY